MGRNRLGLGIGVVLAAWFGIVACGDDGPVDVGPDASLDGAVDAGKTESGPEDAGHDSDVSDAGSKDSGSDARDANVEAGEDAGEDADAGPQPGLVSDLAADRTHDSLTLTWTAPTNSTGTGAVAQYDIRWSTSPITTEAEFLAATPVVVPPLPDVPGTPQTTVIGDLTPETQYHVVLRAEFDDGELGPFSNMVTVTTKARARFLISEIAPVNTAASGGDFVELVATKAGYAGGLRVYYVYGGALHELGPLDVQVGDRIVVHASGLPGPAGFVQEDTTNDKTSSTAAHASANAYDVYSAVEDLPTVAGVIIVAEPGEIGESPDLIRDVVPYSDRSTGELTEDVVLAIWGYVLGGYQWTFSDLAELLGDQPDLCQLYVDAVNASGEVAPTCGGPPGTVTDGRSMQRMGTVDTNTAADFIVGPQTRGAPN